MSHQNEIRTLGRTTEVVYGIARTILIVALALVGSVVLLDPEWFNAQPFWVGAALLIATTVGGLFAYRVMGYSTFSVLRTLAPLDIVALAFLVAGLHGTEDAILPALIAMPVFYAFMTTRREAIYITAACAFAYVTGHLAVFDQETWIRLFFVLTNALDIVFIGLSAALWAERHRERESEIEASSDERLRLNEQLQRRLAELQAVAQITDIIHSSLDFDRVGTLVLDVIGKVLGLTSCALFVIDRQKSETLFSASVGLSGSAVPVASVLAGADGVLEYAEQHFACEPILDHNQMMVVFCTDSNTLAALSAEDRVVLTAVASELVVAVENSQLYKLTKRLAITDELTGLYNYRYLQQRLDEEIERARRYHKDLSFLMLDADDFKGYNDTQGHVAGDVVLAELAAVLRANVREVDVVARYGGEEFSIILPETDAAGAFVVAEKVREAVARHEYPDADGERNQHITVSVGLATYPAHASDKESLLRLADDALYQAKNGGKDRVRSPRLSFAGGGQSGTTEGATDR